MGWGSGQNQSGREVGYSVEASCDEPTCNAEIDRGLAFVCGAEHDGGECGCGGYFCASHLFHVLADDAQILSPQLCNRCCESFQDEPARDAS